MLTFLGLALLLSNPQKYAYSAIQQDNTRPSAEKLVAEAKQFRSENGPSSLRKAIQKFEEALPLIRATGDRQQEAEVLNQIGAVYDLLREFQKALDAFDHALPIHESIANRKGEAETLNQIGAVYRKLEEHNKARDYFARALPIFRAIGNRAGEAETLNYLGLTHSALGEIQKAIEFYSEALPISRAAGDRAGEGATLINIGIKYSELGEPRKAIESYDQALTIFRGLGNPEGEGAALQVIGGLYLSLNESQKALDYFEQGLAVFRAVQNDERMRLAEARALNNIGSVHISLGEYRKALEYFNQALPLFQARNVREAQAITLNNIGRAHDGLSDYGKALEYYKQALPLFQAIGHRRGEAYAVTNIGRVLYAQGENEKALEYFNRALPIRRTVGDRSGEALTLYHIARADRNLGNLTEGQSQIEAALTIIESLRNKLSGEDLRASYFASAQNYFEVYIDLLMRLHKQRPADGFDAAGLEASERARARSLLEILAEARADIREGVDSGLLERERSLQQQLNAKAERQARLLGGKHTPEQAAELAREIESLTTEYQQVRSQIRIRSPRYAALTQPQPLSLKEIQQQVLDSDTLLLEYALGDERSYLWAVTSTSLKTYELPKRAEVESAARSFYEAARTDVADEDVKKAAVNLSQMLLSPVAGQLGSKRLVVVADGALQFVPFAALLVPDVTSVTDRPLILEHEVLSLPSASTLAVLRREAMGRPRAIKTVAVLADPVFDANDQRVRGAKLLREGGMVEGSADAGGKRAKEQQLERSVRESGVANNDARLPRLIGTRREALGILSLVPAGEQKRALDFEASRATATSAQLGQYRFIHFATHGLLNSTHPELSGVVLSLVDDQGRPVDGFLRLNEIYNLRLPAELVVLSACQTGLGKEVRGEGLLSLTRGFMYAGSPRVMASLWKVDDRATTELMKRFYEGVLGPKRLPPAAALRAAQVFMWKQKRWQNSYYWAAFVLQGDWR